MAKQLTILLISVCTYLCLSGSQCKKSHSSPDNPYGLPNVGELGTMGCLINGRAWIASSVSLKAAISGDTVIGITATRSGTYYEQIWVGAKLNAGNLQVGTPITIDTLNYTVSYGSDSTCFGFYPSGLNGRAIAGMLTIIKFDTVGNVFTGTFSATIPLQGCDTLSITYGRFSDNFYRQ